MPAGAAIGGGALVGAGANIYSSNKAASAQQAAAQAAIQAQMQMFAAAQGALNPFISAGQSTLPTLQKLLTPGADMSSVLSQLPGFQFANQYGLKGLTNQATSRGISGNALTAGAQFSSGLASQNYNNLVSQLLGLSGQGVQAGGALAGNAIQSGSNIAGSLTNQGQAQAAGAIGTGNAIAGGANSFGNLATLNALTGGKLFNTSNLYSSTPSAQVQVNNGTQDGSTWG